MSFLGSLYAGAAAPALVCGAVALFAVGCLGGAAALAPVAIGTSGTVVSATSTAMSGSGEGPDKDEKAERCGQLLHAPPNVEEVRRQPDGSIESREIRLVVSQDNSQWVVYRNKDSSPQGWVPRRGLDRLHFDPPLGAILPPNGARYVAYAADVPEKAEDSEQMISVAEDFGPPSGTFQWRSRTYNYTLVKELPCFPGPGD
jgi:hypothetical protein